MNNVYFSHESNAKYTIFKLFRQPLLLQKPQEINLDNHRNLQVSRAFKTEEVVSYRLFVTELMLKDKILHVTAKICLDTSTSSVKTPRT